MNALTGTTILDGSTRVRVNTDLVRLDELSGSGPEGPSGPIGPQGPPGQDGQDGTVGATNFYNKAQVDFLLATNTPNIGTYPGAGVRVWDDPQEPLS